MKEVARMYAGIRGEAVPEPRELHELATIGAQTFTEHGGGGRALGVACVMIALAIIVRLAAKLPQGTPERRALAEAARPLRECLED